MIVSTRYSFNLPDELPEWENHAKMVREYAELLSAMQDLDAKLRGICKYSVDPVQADQAQWARDLLHSVLTEHEVTLNES